MSTTTQVTADQLLRMPEDGYRYELIAGKMVKMTPAGWEHGMAGGELVMMLGEHVRSNQLGKLLLAETGFLIARDPDTVRAPDIAFIRKDNLPKAPHEDAFWPGAPDLVVEVVSPRDTAGQIDDKVKTWLSAGAALVWVVNPAWRSVTVYRSSRDITVLTEDDELQGADVVVGFRCRVGDIFVR